ncbi:MBL fold metallo-hydrolase [Treponema sp. HNW]|uniref:MBL fold metallo-hydrolase n=1 Tax=Treponema sp. HNW TaxID=3116654 RepID=UPI003D12FBD0
MNTYIVPCSAAQGFSRVFIVDPGGHADTIAENTEDCEVAGIILTHGHFDHCGAVKALKKRYNGVPLCIHAGDRAYTGKTAYGTHREDFLRMGALYLMEELGDSFSDFPEANIVFDRDDVLSFAPEWSLIHTSGHSPGSICLYHKSGHLLSGDTLFASGVGRTDLRGGSFDQLQKSLERLFELPDDTKVYPGHGGFTSIGREKLFREKCGF